LCGSLSVQAFVSGGKRRTADGMVSRPGEFHPRPLSGRVEDWRAGLGRSSCSPLARSFVCECHNISTMPRFQSPPRRNATCGFPALRAPICFMPRLMRPILLGQLSARRVALYRR
jgi:hypothetical protein